MKYRTEVFWGEGYRDAAAVMAHEVFELNNTDILVTLQNGILKETDMANRLNLLEHIIDENNDGVISDEDEFEFLLDNPDDHKCIEFFKAVLNEIKQVTGKDIKYCLWLCDTPDDVRRYCIDGQTLSDDDIDTYQESDIVLSDIGHDGKLYGYENPSDIISIDAK